MGKYFLPLLGVATLMILLASSGAYWLASGKIAKADRVAAAATANGTAQTLIVKIDSINAVLDNMGRDPRLLAAINTGDSAQIDAVVRQLEPLLPGVMKLRLFLPGDITPDQNVAPKLGFADVDIARETFSGNQPPMVQGEKADRHLAVARGIKIEQRVIAVLLASLKYDFLDIVIPAKDSRQPFIELQQDGIKLAAAGDAALKETAANEKLFIPDTSWNLQYWYPAGTAFGDAGLLTAIILLPVLATSLVFYLGYRRFAAILHNDQDSILRFIKDLLLEKRHGNYPIRLDELRVILTSVMQFKRIIDAEKIAPNLAKENTETLDMDNFFTSQPPQQEAFFNEEPAPPDIFKTAAEPKAPAASREKILPAQTEITAQPAKPTKSAQPAKAENTSASDTPRRSTDAVGETEVFSIPGLFQLEDDKSAGGAAENIFRAYDIRGIVGETLTREIIYDIGRALGSEAKEAGCQGIVVGRDGRNSSQALSEALNKGIASTGLNILDIGLAPTPVLYFVAHHHPGKSGVMITGSHNPPNYNGLKMVVNGETLAGESIQTLKQRIDRQDFATGPTGSIDRNEMFVNEYIGIISEDVHLGRPMKIVVDCGNGAAGKLAPLLLKTLGCEVVELFCDIDGNFPNHHPDPSKPENLADLIAAVRHYEAEVGLAFDGDGDRLGVIDSKGKIIWPDRQMMLFAKDVLTAKRGAEIIYDVKCSRHLAEQITKFGGRPLMWKTGHSFMKAKLKETGAKLAGEMSGHIFFNDRWFGFDDALYAAARLIEILSADSRTSAEVFAGFPDSVNTPELNVDMPEGQNFKFIESLIDAARFDDAKITVIDGLRADFKDGWGLVRASNTTPSLVIRFEADDVKALSRIKDQFKQLMLQIEPGLQLPF
jgi:phosphomannomutase/phosphoglucomutase